MDINLDYKRIAQRLMRHGLTENQAWDAISREYLSLNGKDIDYVNEAQAAQHFFIGAFGWHRSAVLRPCLTERAVESKHYELERASANVGASLPEDELYVSPEEMQSDVDFMCEVLEPVPQAFKVPTLCVLSSLLKHAPTKPVTIETCRRILKENGIKNGSELSRQIYTFLTTRKPNAQDL